MHLGCRSWTWTRIWDDVRNPLSDVISNSVLGRSNSVFPKYNSLRVFYPGKTEFDLPKTEFEMTSLWGFLTTSQILVHVQLLHPRHITDTQKGYTSSQFLSLWRLHQFILNFCCSGPFLGIIEGEIHWKLLSFNIL